MNKKKMLILLLIFVSVFMVMTAAFANGQWMKAANYKDGSVLVWNPSPTEGETVVWEGGKISSYELTGKESGFPLYYAHGYDGVATWYINGEFEQRDQGPHYGGKRNGEIIQRFADGRTVVANWQHGIKKGKETESITRIFEVKQQEMDILNNSPYHITALFVCPANSEEWQEVLDGTELRIGKQRKVSFNLDNNIHMWDIKVVDSSGGFTVFQNQRIKQDVSSINYYYKDGTGHIGFAVG